MWCQERSVLYGGATNHSRVLFIANDCPSRLPALVFGSSLKTGEVVLVTARRHLMVVAAQVAPQMCQSDLLWYLGC